jgi:hypothetical protein
MDELLEKALREAIANLEVEGQCLPAGGEELIKQRLQKEITEDAFMRRARVLARGQSWYTSLGIFEGIIKALMFLENHWWDLSRGDRNVHFLFSWQI